MGALPAGTLHESSALDDILDGVENAKEKVEKAKAKIQQVPSIGRFGRGESEKRLQSFKFTRSLDFSHLSSCFLCHHARST